MYNTSPLPPRPIISDRFPLLSVGKILILPMQQKVWDLISSDQ